MSDILSAKIDEMIKKSRNVAETDEIRFSLTFNKFNNRRIEYIRRSLKLSKQELLSNLILAAISDIEIKLGIVEPYEQTGEYALTTDYEKIINSNRPISNYFKDKDTGN
jgi:hypothetical protein